MISPVLIVLTGKHKGKRVRLTDAETVIGRDEGAKIRVATHEVSRQHCLLILSDAGVLVRDLGSRNGTFINGMPISEETPLKPGDTLTTGPMTFELEGGDPTKKPTTAINTSQGKADQKMSDDDIASWLTDDSSDSLPTSDTTILSGNSKPATTSSVTSKPPKTPKRDFKSVAEEAQDIIRRHLESLKSSES